MVPNSRLQQDLLYSVLIIYLSFVF